MKTKNKALLMVMSAVVLVVGSVFGTMAYLTDNEAVTNTFTVGQVYIELDEALVNEYGEPLDKDGTVDTDGHNLADRVKEDKYKLIPGHKYTKDPTVHVKNDSEDSYIFIKVENGIADIEADEEYGYQKIETQVLANGWAELDGVANVYCKTWEKPETTTGFTDLIVFSAFEIGGDNVVGGAGTDGTPANIYYLENYKDKSIVVTAYAVQAAGFDTPLDAWKATFGADTAAGEGSAA